MEIIDNKQGRLLGDEFKKRICSNSSLSISTGYFSIYAFHFLKEKLKDVKDARILLLNDPTEVASTGATIQLSTNSALFGDASEQELRNRLLLRNAAEECAEWLKKRRVFVLQSFPIPLE